MKLFLFLLSFNLFAMNCKDFPEYLDITIRFGENKNIYKIYNEYASSVSARTFKEKFDKWKEENKDTIIPGSTKTYSDIDLQHALSSIIKSQVMSSIFTPYYRAMKQEKDRDIASYFNAIIIDNLDAHAGLIAAMLVYNNTTLNKLLWGFK